jgi:multiple sugar transport system ATP-binding protein
VRLIEPLGDITVLDLDLRGEIIKMVLPEDRALAIKPGQPVEVVIAAQNLHLFDRDTGRRID